MTNSKQYYCQELIQRLCTQGWAVLKGDPEEQARVPGLEQQNCYLSEA